MNESYHVDLPLTWVPIDSKTKQYLLHGPNPRRRCRSVNTSKRERKMLPSINNNSSFTSQDLPLNIKNTKEPFFKNLKKHLKIDEISSEKIVKNIQPKPIVMVIVWSLIFELLLALTASFNIFTKFSHFQSLKEMCYLIFNRLRNFFRYC